MGAPRGLAWILFANLAIAIDYSMIMPTGWQYVDSLGGSKLFYGATIAAFPIGRIVFMMPIGAWSDKRGFFAPFRTANAIGLLGGLVYGLASALGSKWFAMLGRFLGGCGATLPLSAWAARSFPPEKRVQIESLQKAAQLVGVALGPALNALFFKLDLQLGFLQLNPLTCAGYFPAFMSLLMLVGFMLGVDEPPAAEAPLVSGGRQEPLRRLSTSGAWCLVFNAFHANVQLAAIDTILAPLAAQHLGWNLLQNSALFAVLAGVSFVGAVVGIIANKRGVKALLIVKLGLLLNIVSSTLVSASLWRAPAIVDMTFVMSAAIFGTWAMLLYTGANGGLYQQALGNSQGFLGALYTMAFAGGRPVGAFLGGSLLDKNPLPSCLCLPALVTAALVLQFIFARRLQSAEDAAIAAHEQGRSASLASDAGASGELCKA